MNKFFKVFLLGILLCLGIIISFSPLITTADDTYHPLAPISSYVPESVLTNNLNNYLNGIFKLGIALAIGLAVVMIIFGGIQYMSTDSWSKKDDGKKRIGAAVLGLIVALGSYMLLNTISPDLLSTDLTLQDLNIGNLSHGPGGGNGGNPGSGTNSPTVTPAIPTEHQDWLDQNGNPVRTHGPVETSPPPPPPPPPPRAPTPTPIPTRTPTPTPSISPGQTPRPTPTPSRTPTPSPTPSNYPQEPGGTKLTCNQLQPAINDVVAGLKDAGITNPADIAAILGQIRQESSFNGLERDTSDNNGGAVGIFQASDKMWDRYTTWAQQNGYQPGSQYAQAYYMGMRLQQNQPDLYNQFINANNPTDALSIWGARPGHYGSTNGWNYWGTTGNRYNYANDFYNNYQNTGNWGCTR